jgi:hypothetical protein
MPLPGRSELLRLQSLKFLQCHATLRKLVRLFLAALNEEKFDVSNQRGCVVARKKKKKAGT